MKHTLTLTLLAVLMVTPALAQEDPTCGAFSQAEVSGSFQPYERYVIKVLRSMDERSPGCDPVAGGGLYGNGHGAPMFDTVKRICYGKGNAASLYDATVETYSMLRGAANFITNSCH